MEEAGLGVPGLGLSGLCLGPLQPLPGISGCAWSADSEAWGPSDLKVQICCEWLSNCAPRSPRVPRQCLWEGLGSRRHPLGTQALHPGQLWASREELVPTSLPPLKLPDLGSLSHLEAPWDCRLTCPLVLPGPVLWGAAASWGGFRWPPLTEELQASGWTTAQSGIQPGSLCWLSLEQRSLGSLTFLCLSSPAPPFLPARPSLPLSGPGRLLPGGLSLSPWVGLASVPACASPLLPAL